MPKKLLIIRHAKSDWANPGISDFNRPLNQRGIVDAPKMGKRLKAKGIFPDAVVSSPATRAITTAKLVCYEFGFDIANIQENKAIFDANCNTLLKIINHFDNKDEFIALFGHNNGITDLAVYLTDAEIFNIPTSGMVLINFPFDDWKMVGKESGEVAFFDYPKNTENA